MNVPNHQMQGNNILHDYDDSGTRTTPGYTVFKSLNSLEDVNAMFCTDYQGFKNGKIAASDTRKYIQNHCTCK